MQNIDIKKLFSKANALYNNNLESGFYVSSKDINGLHVAVYKPRKAYLWNEYVPENEAHVKSLTESFLRGTFKSFYCSSCPMLEKDSFLQETCMGRGVSMAPTENVAYIVNEIFTLNGMEFTICATGLQYYYNHLIFQSVSHQSSYILFEKPQLFSSMFEVLYHITQQGANIKMIFNGSFGSNRWHFHTHITDQRINYVDNNVGLDNASENLTYGVVKFRRISSINIETLFKELQKYTRFVYSGPEYISGNQYISVIFKVNLTTNAFSAFITTGSKITNVSAGTNLITPSAIVIVSEETFKNSTFGDSMKNISKFITEKHIYNVVPDKPNLINMHDESVELLELSLSQDTGWDDSKTVVLTYLSGKIEKCALAELASVKQVCDPNLKAAYVYIISFFILQWMIHNGITNVSTDEQFVAVYRNMYSSQAELRKLVITLGFVQIKTTYESILSGKYDYLKGSVGSLLYSEPFNNFLMLSSIGDPYKADSSLKNFHQLSESINEWVDKNNRQIIGEESGAGQVMKTAFTYRPSYNFVIKGSKSKGGIDPGFIEEFAVGEILNGTRKIIPHFPLTLGGFECNRGNSFVQLCQSGSGNIGSFIILELIEGETFKRYIQTHSDIQIIKCLLQVAFGLYYAQRDFQFTHYDFHDDNAMVSTLPTRSIYKYIINAIGGKSEEYSIDIEDNVFIIDFGWSHVTGVTYKNQISSKAKKWGFTSSKFYPHRDIYTLLCTTLTSYCASRSKNDVENLLTSPLGTMFRQIWGNYVSTLHAGDCSSFSKTIKYIASEIEKIKHLNFKDKKDKCTSILSECTNPTRLAIFLPMDHPEPANTSLSNPYNFIQFISTLIDVHVTDTSLPIYTWGDADLNDIGCRVQKYSSIENVQLIKAIKSSFETSPKKETLLKKSPVSGGALSKKISPDIMIIDEPHLPEKEISGKSTKIQHNKPIKDIPKEKSPIRNVREKEVVSPLIIKSQLKSTKSIKSNIVTHIPKSSKANPAQLAFGRDVQKSAERSGLIPKQKSPQQVNIPKSDPFGFREMIAASKKEPQRILNIGDEMITVKVGDPEGNETTKKIHKICMKGYDLKKWLSTGSYGAVYQVCETEHNCNYVVKIQDLSFPGYPSIIDPDRKEEWEREWKTSKMLYEDYNIGSKFVGFGFCEDDNIGIIVSELWSGSLAGKGKQSPCLLPNIVNRLEKEVEIIGSLGLVHGDILPKNVLVRKDKSGNITDATLTDFGTVDTDKAWQRKVMNDEPQIKVFYDYQNRDVNDKHYYKEEKVTLGQVMKNPKLLDQSLIYYLRHC